MQKSDSIFFAYILAVVAELVYALVLGTSGAILKSSSLFHGTIKICMKNKFTEEEILAIEKELFNLQKKQRKAYLMTNNKLHKTLLFDFLEGIAKGFGFFIGATVVITVLIFLFTKLLVNIPLAGESFENVGKWLQEQQSGTENK